MGTGVTIMKITTFKCDACGKVLSDNKEQTPHIHIKGLVAIAYKPTDIKMGTSWRDCYFPGFPGEMQFCADCFLKFLCEMYFKTVGKMGEAERRLQGLPTFLEGPPKEKKERSRSQKGSSV